MDAESVKMYIARAEKTAAGGFNVGDTIDVGAYFKGACYKSCEGIEDYGKLRVYTETRPEAQTPDVYFPPVATRETTNLTLTLCFFDFDKHADESEAILAVDESYHAFVAYITGSYIKYWDNVRHRKVMLEYHEPTKLVVDRLYGIVYKEVGFKFTNIYGRSFSLDSTEF